ncbi:unnamed protein product [Closterium sp. NIES-53]
MYTLAAEPPLVAASAHVSASIPVAPPCSCRLLSHQTLHWHHRLGHPSLPRLRGMHSLLLVSGLPRSLPPLPPSPAPPCLPCVKGRQRIVPHSSLFPPTTAPVQTLHMDVWGPAHINGQGRERYFLLDLPAPRLHSDRGGEFSSDLLRDFCHGEGILQSFRLPASPQQNGIAERHIGLVMEVVRTSMIHAAAPYSLWPFVVWYAAHRLNLWPHFYHPTSCHVFPSEDVTFDESVPFYRLFPYHSAPPPPPPLFLAPGPPLADPLPPRVLLPQLVVLEVLRLLVLEVLVPGVLELEARAQESLELEELELEGGGAGDGGTGAGGIGAGAGGAGAAYPRARGSGGTGARGHVQPRPYFLPLLQQVLSVPSSTSLTPPLLCPLPDQSQPPLQPTSPLPAPSPYTEHSGGLTERRFSQRRGVDYFHTFSPTPKMTTLRVFLHVAAHGDYGLHSLDFSTAFLQGSLHEEIWLRRPPGFIGSFPAGTQWSLRWPVYGLRQAPREWHDTLRTTLAALEFTPSTADPLLFLRTDTSLPPFYVLVYVDDLAFATADTEALTLVKSKLQKRHTCTDLGEMRSNLGLQITRDKSRQTFILTQSYMVHQVLQRFGFQFSSAQPTPLSTSHSFSAPPSDESVELSGPYPELVGCLMYLLARYVAPGNYRKVHWDATKRVLRYLGSTSGMGLVLGGRGPVFLTGHADASLVDDSATQRSSRGYTFSLGSGSDSWQSTRSSSVLSSSCEAEIHAEAMAVRITNENVKTEKRRGQVWRRDYERRGGSGRQLKLLAHGATGATGTLAIGATGTLATGATGTRATGVTGSAANSERLDQWTHGRLEQRAHGQLERRAHGRLAQRSHGRLELLASRRPPPFNLPQLSHPPFTHPAALLASLPRPPLARLLRLPHTHPPQRQLQQWEREEEEQGTTHTRHPHTLPHGCTRSREMTRKEGGGGDEAALQQHEGKGWRAAPQGSARGSTGQCAWVLWGDALVDGGSARVNRATRAGPLGRRTGRRGQRVGQQGHARGSPGATRWSTGLEKLDILTMAAQELRWLTYLLTDLGEQPRSPPVLYQRGQLRLAYVATRANTADIFTKALPPDDYQRFSTVLGLVHTLPHLLSA